MLEEGGDSPRFADAHALVAQAFEGRQPDFIVTPARPMEGLNKPADLHQAAEDERPAVPPADSGGGSNSTFPGPFLPQTGPDLVEVATYSCMVSAV